MVKLNIFLLTFLLYVVIAMVTMAKGSESAVKLVNVFKRYSDITAVDNVNFEVKQGEIFGLLGPNGSGKSTTLKIILGLVKADSGSANVLGIGTEENSIAIKQQVGYVPESPHLYEFLTGI